VLRLTGAVCHNPRMSASDVLVVGGGMAGLAAAWVCARAGRSVTLVEQAHAFGEVGAGLQLGPNAVRVLAEWGLDNALASCAAYPDKLQARDARDGRLLGELPLGERARRLYGHPYATVHRADLHALLHQALVAQSGPDTLRLDTRLSDWSATGEGVRVQLESRSHGSGECMAQALLGCDGLWSRVREGLLADGPPTPTGHLAYRGLIPMADAPRALRQGAVVAWLAPHWHAVHYPVRRGEWLNLVVVIDVGVAACRALTGWDHAASAADLNTALVAPVHRDLQPLLDAVPHWRMWPLNDRAPLTASRQQAQGPVALLGDAAHPMRPYLAQGAAMALEDAWALGHLLQAVPAAQTVDWSALLDQWARQRWARNAWVQARSRRNGRVFHATGVVRLARNLALRAGGERLMDVPRLYAGPP
jgi:salicylate hydroxylase